MQKSPDGPLREPVINVPLGSTTRVLDSAGGEGAAAPNVRLDRDVDAGLTDYHAKYFAHELTKRCPSDSADKLAVAVADLPAAPPKPGQQDLGL